MRLPCKVSIARNPAPAPAGPAAPGPGSGGGPEGSRRSPRGRGRAERFADGGTDDLSNLRPACTRCNRGRR
ncbi:MAG: HNH endonuclease [Solirubrobacterales bacterium]